MVGTVDLALDGSRARDAFEAPVLKRKVANRGLKTMRASTVTARTMTLALMITSAITRACGGGSTTVSAA